MSFYTILKKATENLRKLRYLASLVCRDVHSAFMDWFGNAYSESAGELGWKSCHVIKLDNGYFAAQPNNRILWDIPAWTKIDKKPDYLITEKTYKCELGKINIEDAKFFY